MGVDDGQLVRATDQLVEHVGHWAPARWTRPASGGPDGESRADVVHGLAQRLADLEADVTGRPGLPVPRLGNDLALPDQVRVMVLDLVRAQAGPAVLAAALDAVTESRKRL